MENSTLKVNRHTDLIELAKMLNEREKKKSLLVSCDIYRPAAIEQLKTLATQVGAEFFPSSTDQKPTDIANAAIAYGLKKYGPIHLEVLKGCECKYPSLNDLFLKEDHHV